MKLAEAQQVPVIGHLNVLACAQHAPLVGVSVEGSSRVGKWIWKLMADRFLGGVHGQR